MSDENELKHIADEHQKTQSLPPEKRIQYLEFAMQFQAELGRRGIDGAKADFLLQALPSRIDYIDAVQGNAKFNPKSAVDSALNSSLGELVNAKPKQKQADPNEVTAEVLAMSPVQRIAWARKRGLA